MQQCRTVGINAAAGNTGSVEINDAATVPNQTCPEAGAPLQLMVHVPEHNPDQAAASWPSGRVPTPGPGHPNPPREPSNRDPGYRDQTPAPLVRNAPSPAGVDPPARTPLPSRCGWLTPQDPPGRTPPLPPWTGGYPPRNCKRRPPTTDNGSGARSRRDQPQCTPSSNASCCRSTPPLRSRPDRGCRG